MTKTKQDDWQELLGCAKTAAEYASTMTVGELKKRQWIWIHGSVLFWPKGRFGGGK